MDGDAGDVGADALALAGVQAGAHRDAGRAGALDDAQRAADRAGQAVEGGDEAVAEGLDLLAAVEREPGADERVVRVEQLAPRAVAASAARPVGPTMSVKSRWRARARADARRGCR